MQITYNVAFRAFIYIYPGTRKLKKKSRSNTLIFMFMIIAKLPINIIM